MNLRIAAIVGMVIAIILLFSSCQPAASSDASKPAGMGQAASSTAATPTTTLRQTVAPILTPTSAPRLTVPPYPEDFIVGDEYWDYASFFYYPDGNPSYGDIYFLGFPEGMTLYAPMSGYITLASGTVMGVDHNTVRIAESADGPLEWDQCGPTTGRYITIVARGMELLEVGVKNDALYVEKGEPFAKVTKKGEVFPGEFKEKPELLVGLDRHWMDMLDVSTEAPREFMWYAIQIAEAAPKPEPTAIPEPTVNLIADLPPVPNNFIVKDGSWDSICCSYSIFNDGGYGCAAYFSDISVGDKLYAPISGYVTVTRGDDHVTIHIAESADDITLWDMYGPKTGKYVVFTVKDIELLNVGDKDGALYVEHGEPFAKVTKNEGVHLDWSEDEFGLIFEFDRNWSADIYDYALSYNGDLKKLVWAAIQLIENKEGN